MNERPLRLQEYESEGVKIVMKWRNNKSPQLPLKGWGPRFPLFRSKKMLDKFFREWYRIKKF
jgi:hypothetical protein